MNGKKKRKKKKQNNLAHTFVRWRVRKNLPPTTQTSVQFGDFAELYISSLFFNKSLLNLEAAA